MTVRLAQAAEYLSTALGHAQSGANGTGRPPNVTPKQWRAQQASDAAWWTLKGLKALGVDAEPRRPPRPDGGGS